MTAPTFHDLLAMVAAMHTSGAITLKQAAEILADRMNFTLGLSTRIILIFERQAADEWVPLRDNAGRWTR